MYPYQEAGISTKRCVDIMSRHSEICPVFEEEIVWLLEVTKSDVLTSKQTSMRTTWCSALSKVIRNRVAALT